MSSADFLLTLAEISIAFVGFSAIVMVFRRFAAERQSAFQSLQVSMIIRIGLLALFLSLLPLLLGQFPIAELRVWRLSSLLFAIAVILLVVFYARSRAGVRVPPEVTSSTYIFRMALVALLIMLQLLNAALIPASSAAAVYCAGVVWLLAMLAWIFVGAWRLWGGSDTNGV